MQHKNIARPLKDRTVTGSAALSEHAQTHPEWDKRVFAGQALHV